VLYELFTGRRPFAGESVLELFDAIRSKDPALASALRPGISSDVDRILARMLSKSIADRYRTGPSSRLTSADAGSAARHQQRSPTTRNTSRCARTPSSGASTTRDLGARACRRWSRAGRADSVLVREDEPARACSSSHGSAKVLKQGRLLNVLQTASISARWPTSRRRLPRQATAVAAPTSCSPSSSPPRCRRSAGTASCAGDGRYCIRIVDRLALSNERLARVLDLTATRYAIARICTPPARCREEDQLHGAEQQRLERCSGAPRESCQVRSVNMSAPC
jgi:serine/threonine protein kinase